MATEQSPSVSETDGNVERYEYFLTDEHRELVADFAGQLKPGVKKIRVYQVARLGQSGAQVCRVLLDRFPPYIFKLGKPEKIKQEHSGYACVAPIFKDAQLGLELYSGSHCSAKLHALAYIHAGGSSEAEARESNELEKHILGKQKTTTWIAKILRKLYKDGFRKARENTDRVPCVLRTLYTE